MSFGYMSSYEDAKVDFLFAAAQILRDKKLFFMALQFITFSA